jgi:succinate dehydrogenase / fumarate reductase membrane anchor subunit
MSFRTPMSRARGFGSAKDGTGHWWQQRLTSIALIPLTVWFVASIVSLTGAGHVEVAAWIGAPLPATFLILLIVVSFHHAQLGLQVVIEDYVHSEGMKFAAVIFVKFAAAVLGLLAVLAVLKIAFGG